jgi:hypothetical protein
MTNSTVPPPDTVKLQSEVDDILSTLPEETETEVILPSKGRFYGDQCPTGRVTVRPLSFDDEKALLSSKNKEKLDAPALILKRCVQGVDAASLVFMDKMFLVMKIREISYGDEYLVEVKCSECGVSNPLSIMLSKLEINYVPDDFKDPRELELPILKKKIKIRLPRVYDEPYLNKTETMLDNLWRFIVEIDGNSKELVISKVIPQLRGADIHTIVKALNLLDYGIENKARFTCGKCDSTNDITIPISENFFSVN